MKQYSVWGQEGQGHLTWDGCFSLKHFPVKRFNAEKFCMQYFWVGFFFLVVVLLRRVCSSSANSGSRGNWHWEAAQGAALFTQSEPEPATLLATHGAEMGNKFRLLISPYLFFLLPFPSGLYAQTGGGLTCLWVYANDSAAVNAGHPELPFRIYAHPVRHLLLLFQMVQKFGAGCRESYKADVMWAATHSVSVPSLTSSMLLQTATFIFWEKDMLQNVHHIRVLQVC